MQSTIRIGQLNLRIPGHSAETGHGVAQGIASSLARKVPAGMRRRLGALDLRVRLSVGASQAEISDAVSEAIVRALHRGSQTASAGQG